MLPDGLAPLLRAAAALPALLVMPVLGSVIGALPVVAPVVVPVVEDPAVVPLVVEPPVPDAPPLDCARAKELVNASAVANPIVASFMLAPFWFA